MPGFVTLASWAFLGTLSHLLNKKENGGVFSVTNDFEVGKKSSNFITTPDIIV